MASDRFEIEPAPTEKRGWGGCLTGCLIGFGIAVLVAVLSGWWVMNNWKGWAVTLSTQALEASIEESELPAQEKAELKAELKRLRDGYAEGNISDEQMVRVGETIIQSPLMRMFMVKAVETYYVARSGFDEEEKADAKVVLQRFASGLMSQKIGQDDLDDVLTHVGDRDANGNFRLREQVTDEELRAFLEAANQKADIAEIPAEIEPVDPSDELKRIIDNALAEP